MTPAQPRRLVRHRRLYLRPRCCLRVRGRGDDLLEAADFGLVPGLDAIDPGKGIGIPGPLRGLARAVEVTFGKVGFDKEGRRLPANVRRGVG